MRLEFDAAKNAANIRERGLAFEQVVEFDFAGALVKRDDRKAYPEVRFVAIGLVGGRLHVLCFTPVPGGIRVISFRKANSREAKRHEQASSAD